MKTYKHSTTGYKAESKVSNPHSYIVEMDDRVIALPAQLVEDPGFGWVLQKDYEILEVRGPAGGSFKPITPAHIRDFPIYSVKRSDGEVISIDDDVYHVEFVPVSGKVESIHETVDGINIVYSKNAVSYVTNLNEIKKCKPILTSEDGVELFEGDTAFLLEKGTLKPAAEINITKRVKKHKAYIYFSTCEAAERYRVRNARLLCIEDFVKLCGISNSNLENLVKSRL